jgi:hypothetical protein
MAKYVDNDKREEKLINKVKKKSGYSKGQAIAALKSKGVLKQAKGKKGLKVKKKK